MRLTNQTMQAVSRIARRDAADALDLYNHFVGGKPSPALADPEDTLTPALSTRDGQLYDKAADRGDNNYVGNVIAAMQVRYEQVFAQQVARALEGRTLSAVN